MLEFYKINKDTKNKVNLPEKKEIEKVKGYAVIRILSGWLAASKDLETEGKIYLNKDQAILQAKLLQMKNPIADIKIFEMEIE